MRTDFSHTTHGGHFMSGVFFRFRGRTQTQFEANALKIQTLITKYATKDKFIPKKYRLLLGIPLINKADEMVDNITFANSIKAETEKGLELRKTRQSEAIANCFQLQNLIVKLEKTVETVTIDSLDEIITLLCEELKLLIAWRNSERIRDITTPRTKTYNKPVYK